MILSENFQDNWLLHSMTEAKLPYNVSGLPNFKFVDEEFDGHAKSKKLKTSKDNGIRKAPSTHSASESEGNCKTGGKNNIKNTYINKINHLINDEKAAKAEKEKKYLILIPSSDFISDEPRGKNESKKSLNIKNEMEMQNAAPKGGMKKVRSYDVLKSDEIGTENFP